MIARKLNYEVCRSLHIIRHFKKKNVIMKISTETYQYQSYSGQYERFAPGYVQPDYALLIDAIIRYFIIIGTLK